MALFGDVKVAKPNAVFHLNDLYKKDPDPKKLNLGVGAFRDDFGRPVVMDVVKEVELEMARDVDEGRLNHEYPPMGGSQELVGLAAGLIFGDDAECIRTSQVQGVQTVSGTGALRVVADFLHDFHPETRNIMISDPSWENHTKIFSSAGLRVSKYRYYDEATRGLNFKGLVQDLSRAERGTMVCLHACAHNPTGVDPTREEWQSIADIFKARGLVAVFDSAYLGYVSGKPGKDAYAMRLFDRLGLSFFVCVSFSKNFGLYSERCGVALYHGSDAAEATAVNSQIKLITRRLWSVPPMHGANIVLRILGDPKRAKKWHDELQEQADRIGRMRRQLYEALIARDPHRNWSHVTRQTGMFSYTGLSPSHCEELIKEHHVYLLASGRINVSGIPANAIERLADAVCSVVGKAPVAGGSVESLDSLADGISDNEVSSTSDVELAEVDDADEHEDDDDSEHVVSASANRHDTHDSGMSQDSCCSSVSD